jgi:Domain of unknown function (DUF5671)
MWKITVLLLALALGGCAASRAITQDDDAVCMLFAALYVSALNLASLAFIFIDHYFPGPLQNHSLSAAADTIRWNVASLIVAFPLFLFTFRAINKAISEDPSKRGSRPRKWLVYLTLWVAVLVLTGETQRVDLQDTWRRAYNPVRAQSH